MDEDQKMIEMIVVRGTVVKGKDVKRGDKIQVPEKHKLDGVYPVRWWRNNKKAALDETEFKEFCEGIDVQKNPAAPPAKGKG